MLTDAITLNQWFALSGIDNAYKPPYLHEDVAIGRKVVKSGGINSIIITMTRGIHYIRFLSMERSIINEGVEVSMASLIIMDTSIKYKIYNLAEKLSEVFFNDMVVSVYQSSISSEGDGYLGQRGFSYEVWNEVWEAYVEELHATYVNPDIKFKYFNNQCIDSSTSMVMIPIVEKPPKQWCYDWGSRITFIDGLSISTDNGFWNETFLADIDGLST